MAPSGTVKNASVVPRDIFSKHYTMRDRSSICVRYEIAYNMFVYNAPEAFLRRSSAVPRNKPYLNCFFEKRSLMGGGGNCKRTCLH
jgi:hypothetical protein